jgi:hypothetical protein
VLARSLAEGVLGAEGASIVLAEWRDPGGAPDPPRYIAPLHVHERDDEAWYVLEGTLRFRLDDEEVEAATYWNPRAEPARYLLVMTERIAALIEALHAPGARDDMAAIFRAHDSALIGWPE